MTQEIVFVDHSSHLGGGQLALSRYILWQERTIPIHLIVFEDGELGNIARSAPLTRVTVLSANSLPQRVIELNKILRGSKQYIVANSLSAFLHLSLTPAACHRVIDYLRQEAYPFEASYTKKVFLKYFAYPIARGFISNSRYSLQTLSEPQREKLGRIVYTISGRSETDLAQKIPNLHQPLQLLSLSRLSPGRGFILLWKLPTALMLRLNHP